MSHKKLAVVSHIFPPYPSGQSMVLNHMLRPLDPDSYELICTRDYTGYVHNTASQPLPVPINTIKAAGESSVEQMAIMRFLRPVDPYRPIRSRQLLRPFWIVYSAIRSKLKSALTRLFTIRIRAKEIERLVKETNCEAILACTGDLYTLPAAYRASKSCGVPFLTYIFDDYLYQYFGTERLIARFLEPHFMKGAVNSIVTNSFVQDAYRQRYNIDSTVMHNAAILPDLAALDQQPPVLDSATVNIVYTGAVYHAHYDAFQNMVKALDRLNRDDIKLHIFSSQSPEEIAAQGIESQHIVHHGHIPHDQVARVQRDADILFLPLAFHSEIDVVLRNASPGKVGEYLGAGRPILVHTRKDYFLCHYFKQHQCGAVVDELDPDRLADEITALLNDKARQQEYAHNARARAEIDFDVYRLQERFQTFLQENTNS